MPSIDFVTPEERADDLRRIARLEALLEAYVQGDEQWLPTDQALTKAGIRSRETLEKHARASRPGTQEAGRISYKKEGKKCLYARSSCIDYAQRKLGQPALRP